MVHRKGFDKAGPKAVVHGYRSASMAAPVGNIAVVSVEMESPVADTGFRIDCRGKAYCLHIGVGSTEMSGPLAGGSLVIADNLAGFRWRHSDSPLRGRHLIENLDWLRFLGRGMDWFVVARRSTATACFVDASHRSY